jgi:hypothetical protein
MQRMFALLDRMSCLVTEGDWPSNRAEFLKLEVEVTRMLQPSR